MCPLPSPNSPLALQRSLLHFSLNKFNISLSFVLGSVGSYLIVVSFCFLVLFQHIIWYKIANFNIIKIISVSIFRIYSSNLSDCLIQLTRAYLFFWEMVFNVLFVCHYLYVRLVKGEFMAFSSPITYGDIYNSLWMKLIVYVCMLYSIALALP